MSYVSVGSCPKCGAPIYAESSYWSTLPPASVHTCSCARGVNPTITVYPSTSTTTKATTTWNIFDHLHTQNSDQKEE